MILIDSAHLSATLLDAERKDVLVVTFNDRPPPPPATAGTAQDPFRQNGVPCVHFIAKQDHGWLTEELDPALDLVAYMAKQQGYRSIVTHGVGRGGYGALIASGRLRAIRSVVYRPQFSVDDHERRLTDDRFEARLGPGEIYVFSDPNFDIDQRHVDMIAARRPVRQTSTDFARNSASPQSGPGVLQAAMLKALLGGGAPAADQSATGDPMAEALTRAADLVRAGATDRETLNDLADCVRDAAPRHAADMAQEFRDVFLEAEGPTLRLIGALMGKDLDQQVLELCDAGAARFPNRAAKFDGVRARLGGA